MAKFELIVNEAKVGLEVIDDKKYLIKLKKDGKVIFEERG